MLGPYTARGSQSHSALLPFPYYRPKRTSHHMSIRKLSRTLSSKLDKKNRASELATHSGVPSTPASRTTQCYFPCPLLYLRRAPPIAARSQEIGRSAAFLALSAFFCSRWRVSARESVCVRVLVFLCRTAQYRDTRSRQ